MNRLSQFFGQKKNETKKNEDFEEDKEDVEEKEKQRLKIIEGYPKTKTPFIPEIMKNKVEFKTIKNIYGNPIIGFTLAPKGSELVNAKSLEMIRKKILSIYTKHPMITKKFKNPLPRNTIAISFSEYNFHQGKSCQEFKPVVGLNDGYFTYQKLSENVQLTNYNKNGVEFLAGYCYYLVPNGKPKLLASDSALITWGQLTAEQYPLENREKAFRAIAHQTYGRYCKTAGKRVVVDCSKGNEKICHSEFNHLTEKWETTPCNECLKEAITYKWEDPKKTSSQPSKTLEEQIIIKIEHLEKVNQILAESYQFNDKITVFNRKTGELLEASKCPKITKLSIWLDANSAYNVCSNSSLSALMAHLTLGLAYSARIGGNSIATSDPLTSASVVDAQLALPKTIESISDEPSLTSSEEDLANSQSSSNTEESPEAATSSVSSIPSSATSAESLLEDYDKIDEETTEHNDEFNAEVIN